MYLSGSGVKGEEDLALKDGGAEDACELTKSFTLRWGDVKGGACYCVEGEKMYYWGVM